MRPDSPGMKFEKMASNKDDFLYGDDYEAVIIAIGANVLENDEKMESEINSFVDKVPSDKGIYQYQCEYCEKICLSKSGLSRHLRAKHPQGEKEFQKDNVELEIEDLKIMIEKSAAKLATDGCYTESIMQEFKNFKIVSLEDIVPAYNLMLPVIKSFKGDTEKFYPSFYKIFSNAENVYKNLGSQCSLLLSFEVANHVLSHLTGGTFKEDVITFDDFSCSEEFSEKESSLISYLSGYVFGTLYRRIRFSKSGKGKSYYGQQCLSFLLAGKCSGESISLPEHAHVELMDRGGLWKVTSNATSIFKVAEHYFKQATQRSVKMIDCKTLIKQFQKERPTFRTSKC